MKRPDAGERRGADRSELAGENCEVKKPPPPTQEQTKAEPRRAPRPSFLDRYKQMMMATPRALDPTHKLVLWATFAFAHDDGTGIYVGTDTLMECTGLPRSTMFRGNRGKTPGEHRTEAGQSGFDGQKMADFCGGRSAGGRMLHLLTRGFAPVTFQGSGTLRG